MQRRICVIVCTVLVSLIMCLYILPDSAKALNRMPSNLFLLEDAEIYNDFKHPGKPVAALSAFQTVNVVGMDKGLGDAQATEWYLIETWLGNKWIKANTWMTSGIVQEESKEITTVYDIPLYDWPDPMFITDLSISPQKLRSTGSIAYSPLQFVNTFGAAAGSGFWYRIDTWVGDKWILNPSLLEDVKEKPISYNLKLTGEETVYPHPFPVKSESEKLDSQVVQVVAVWDHRTGPGQGSLWYKIILPRGERWVLPRYPIIPNYRELKDPITLPTETRYFDKPFLTSETNWLEPGTYEAFEASGDWVHIRTKQGEAWVNPKRALLERPVGIVKTDEKIDLVGDEQTYKYPWTGEVAQPKGFYAPQTVQAFEKWTSETGDIWYHFHGYKIDVWIVKS